MKIRRPGLLIILISLCLSSSALSADCWNRDAVSSLKNPLFLLNGDRYNINLDTISEGSNLQYSIKSDNDSKQFFGQLNTFSTTGTKSPLSDSVEINKCVDKAAGLNDNDLVLLCDDRIILFVSYHMSNGSLYNSHVTSLGNDTLKCNSITSGDIKKIVYIVCTQPDDDKTNIVIYRIDTAFPSEYTEVVISQTLANQTLKENLKISVSQTQHENDLDTLIYVWEGSVENQAARFRILKERNTRLIDGGFYTSENELSKDLEAGIIQKMMHSESFVHVITRKDGDLYAQKCYRAPVYSKFTFIKQSYSKIATGAERMIVDSSRMISNLSTAPTVYFVSKEKITFGLFYSFTSSIDIEEEGSLDISGISLKKIVGIFMIDGSLSLVGPTTDNSELIDGVVKFKAGKSYYDETSIRERNPSYTFTLANPIMSNQGFVITIGTSQMTMYRIAHNSQSIVINNFPEQQKLTLACSNSDKSAQGTFELTLQSQLNVNDNPKFFVSPVETYLGSVYVEVPSNQGDILGNAPQIDLKSDDSRLKLKVDHIKSREVSYTSKPLENISGLMHVGQNVYAQRNESEVSYFKCNLLKPDKNEYECEEVSSSVQLKEGDITWKYVDSEVSNRIVVTLLTSFTHNTSTTRMIAKDLDDGVEIFEPIDYDFVADNAMIYFIETKITLVAIGSPKPDSPQSVSFASYDYSQAKNINVLNKLIDLPSHVCPTEMWRSPNQGSLIFIASVCGKSAMNNHIFRFDMEQKPYKLLPPILILGSRSFGICAQHNVINVIDKEQNVAYSIVVDKYGNQVSRVYMPLKRFGFTSILDFSCSETNGILQILSQKISGKFLVTLRANELRPNYRIHSIVKVRDDAMLAASTFNDDNDDAQAIVIGKRSTDMSLYILDVEGPHIHLENVAAFTQPGEYNFTYKFTLPGKSDSDDRTFDFPGSVKLHEQKSKIDLFLKDKNMMAPLSESAPVNLDEYIITEGPYLRAKQRKSGHGSLIDRISPSNHFKNLTTPFENSIMHQNYVFGYKRDGEQGEFMVTDGEIEIREAWTGDIIINRLLIVEKSAKNFYFFAQYRQRFSKDTLICFFTEDGGETWNKSSTYLQVEGFKDLSIASTQGDKFALAGYSNFRQHKVYIFAFTVTMTQISILDSNRIITFDRQQPVADLSMVYLDSKTENKLVLIFSTEFETQAFFARFKVEIDGQLSLRGSSKAELVPNIQESHRGIIFTCKKEKDSDSNIFCVVSGKNLYSYLTKYEFDFSNQLDLTIKSQKVVTMLQNMANLRPMKVELEQEFVAFTVKNLKPRKSSASLGDSESQGFFVDPYLVLIYKTDSLISSVEENKIPSRHPYKVLQSSDFGVDDVQQYDFTKINARLYKNKEEVLKVVSTSASNRTR